MAGCASMAADEFCKSETGEARTACYKSRLAYEQNRRMPAAMAMYGLQGYANARAASYAQQSAALQEQQRQRPPTYTCTTQNYGPGPQTVCRPSAF